MNKVINILHLEDDPRDAELIREILISGDIDCNILVVQTKEEFIQAITNNTYDLILSDYQLPSFDGISALQQVKKRGLEIPFIFVSGIMGEDTAIDTLVNGATDYVLKNKLSRIVPAVNRAFNELIEKRRRTRIDTIKDVRFRLLNDIYTLNLSIYDISTRILHEVVSETFSNIGFIYFLEEKQTQFYDKNADHNSETHQQDAIKHNMQNHEAIQEIWNDIIETKKPIIINDFFSHPYHKIIQEDHPSILNLLIVPIIRNDIIVSIISVANKEGYYDEIDVQIISHLSDFAWEIIERKKIEYTLRKISFAVEQSPVSIILTDPSGIIEYVNPKFDEFTQYTLSDVIGKNVVKFLAMEQYHSSLSQVLKHGIEWEGQVQSINKDGLLFWVKLKISPILANNNQISNFMIISEDITQSKYLEEQIRQTQKLEAINNLVGGVTHDFNNILHIILVLSKIGMDEMIADEKIFDYFKDIHKAANRAAGLTKQLLTFARKQPISPKLININAKITEMIDMLRRLIGENIDLIWNPCNGIEPIMIDPSQVDQIIINLCVNSRDAIPDIGKITIETKMIIVGENTKNIDTKPGLYVQIVISDNGLGMEKEIQNRIYEPFFTTKKSGTGLGLATIYGIVKQNDGFIDFTSRLGIGTTFEVNLPVSEQKDQNFMEKKEIVSESNKTGTILLVEDEQVLLDLIARMLKKFGFQVISANRPSEAIKIMKNNLEDIRLLLTDMVMPEMNGIQLANAIREIQPKIKCLFMSGYPGGVLDELEEEEVNIEFLQKPFSMQTLEDKLHNLLSE